MKRLIFSFLVFPIALLIGLIAFHLIDSREEQIEVFTVTIPTLPHMDFSNAETPDKLSDKLNENNKVSEYFIDKSRVGRPGRNKVEIKCFENEEGTKTEIRFYSKAKTGEWNQRQFLEFQKGDGLGCEPKIKDFNGDGLKDLTYVSGIAARGANEIRTLFIYDKEKDELVEIKNSAEFPNLAYNKKLNCIDAWAFTATTTTIFLKLEGDTLREFASVDTGNDLVVTVTNKDGQSRVLSRKKMREDDIYTRYSTFDPPRP